MIASSKQYNTMQYNTAQHISASDIRLGTHALFCLIMLLHTLLLCFMISETSIYIHEAQQFFRNDTLPYHLANLGVWCVQALFGDPMLNDYGLRLPFVLLHLINCTLLYAISLSVLRKPNDALLCVLLFVSIPGVSLQALVVSYMGILTLLCFLIIYIQVRYRRIAYELFCIAIFLDAGSAILCLALFFYALYERKTYTIIFSMLCFGITMYQFAPIHGIPRSYFLDTLGLMALVFTPVLLVYYIAATYSYTLKRSPTLLHLIPFVGFIFILLLSVRQKIEVESFLPPLCVGIPIFIQRIVFDIRSRLPRFRQRYILRIAALVLFLLLGNVVLFGNKLIYYVSDVQRNFAYSFYAAKEVAQALHERKITSIEIPNGDLAVRLRFYGIEQGDSKPKYRLEMRPDGDIQIIYGARVLAQYAVVPL